MTEREREAAEYARRQWADTAPEDYVEGSKNDYLAGYDAAMEKAVKWICEHIDEYARIGDDGPWVEHRVAADIKKAMEE